MLQKIAGHLRPKRLAHIRHSVQIRDPEEDGEAEGGSVTLREEGGGEESCLRRAPGRDDCQVITVLEHCVSER